MLEFVQFTVGKWQFRYSHISACALIRARNWRAGLALANFSCLKYVRDRKPGTHVKMRMTNLQVEMASAQKNK